MFQWLYIILMMSQGPPSAVGAVAEAILGPTEIAIHPFHSLAYLYPRLVRMSVP